VVNNADIVLMNQDILEESWLYQKKYLNLRLIVLTMEPNKIHDRILEIQEQIQNASSEQQTSMLNELFELASKIEQSLSDLKIETNE